MQPPVALAVLFDHYGMDTAEFLLCAQVEIDLSVQARSFSGANHGPPIIDGIFLEEQNLKFSSAVAVLAPQAGGNHFGIIQDEHIPCAKIFQQIGKSAMEKFSGWAVQHQETGLIAR